MVNDTSDPGILILVGLSESCASISETSGAELVERHADRKIGAIETVTIVAM